MRIFTVCNYRTGSSAFSLKKADENGIPWYGELFHDNRMHSIGDVPQGWTDLEKIGYKGKIPGSTNAENGQIVSFGEAKHDSDKRIIEIIRNGEPGSFNMKPAQLQREDETFLPLCDAVDKIYFLYRRNFHDQVRSYVYAALKSDWAPARVFVNAEPGTHQWYMERIWQTAGRRPGNVELSSGPTHRFVLDKACVLIREYYWMYKLWLQVKDRPNVELVAYEDYFVNELYLPYNKNITMQRDDYMYPDFDPTSLFERNEAKYLSVYQQNAGVGDPNDLLR